MYSNLLLKGGKNQIYLVLNIFVSMSHLKISSLNCMTVENTIWVVQGCVRILVMFRLENLPSEPILSRNHLQKQMLVVFLARLSCFFEALNWSKLLLPKYLWCPKDNHHICIVEVLPKIQDLYVSFKITNCLWFDLKKSSNFNKNSEKNSEKY